ncbi:NAD(P)H-binding protein [Flectobacillus major]|uniref:NAD(P)H-binding protein n=1 Tax=Flectobacillus major TaxID=103 RepID=UPI0003FC389D|nr:NAD(P)H-binding protein [Flectobacillus major]
MKKAIIIGATGLVGSTLTKALLADTTYSNVVLLVRTKVPLQHPKLQQVLFDFDNPDSSLVQGDILFCAMGTTLAKAGSKAVQYKIDCTYPYEIAKIAKANGIEQYFLVSSIGADERSSNFYLRTKGDLEEKLKSLQFSHFVSVRPSIILGNRQEKRIGEKIGIILVKLIEPLLLGSLKKYRGVHVDKIVKMLISRANAQNPPSIEIIESDKIAGI